MVWLAYRLYAMILYAAGGAGMKKLIQYALGFNHRALFEYER
jgi:hypothetical protein